MSECNKCSKINKRYCLNISEWRVFFSKSPSGGVFSQDLRVAAIFSRSPSGGDFLKISELRRFSQDLRLAALFLKISEWRRFFSRSPSGGVYILTVYIHTCKENCVHNLKIDKSIKTRLKITHCVLANHHFLFQHMHR